MEDFSKRIIDGNGIIPPEKCLKVFMDNFPDALNIDWFNKGDLIEAVFYKEQIEYIADFSREGSLIEYKMFLPLDYLPGPIRAELTGTGEIMNVVLINNGSSIKYECIIRDLLFNRTLFLITGLGRVIEERNL